MTPRTPAQNENRRESTRQQILDTALKAFSRYGYEGASVRVIAGEAGIAQGLLYSHFAGKAELLQAIFERGMNDVRESFLAAAAKPTNSGTPLELLIRSSFTILRLNLNFWKLTYGIRMQESVLKSLSPILQNWTGEILKTLEAYFHAEGVNSPRSEAAILFATIDGIGQHYALDPKHYPLDSVVDLLVLKCAPASASPLPVGMAVNVSGRKIKKSIKPKSGKTNDTQLVHRKKPKP